MLKSKSEGRSSSSLYRAFSLKWTASMQSYWNKRKRSTPKGLVWNTNMAAVLLFWKTSKAAVTSCENALYFWVHTHLLDKLENEGPLLAG